MGAPPMIEAAVIAVGVAVIADAMYVALLDVRFMRRRVDRRWRRG